MSLTGDLRRYEDALRAQGFSRVAGVDEAGRGALAGPLVAAAVILPEDFDTTGIRDSTYVVGLWASEWSAYDYASNTCTPPPPPAPQTCGHYTQLVWRGTVNIGCALVTCSTGWPFGGTPPADPRWDFWVCDYDPPGNIVGQRPY